MSKLEHEIWKERKGRNMRKERKIRKGKENKGKERKGKERKGKERKGCVRLAIGGSFLVKVRT